MDVYFVPPQTSLAAVDDEKNIRKASEALPALGKALAKPVKEFWDGFASVGREPTEVELNLKLLFEGEAGWAIVSARSEASMSVTLKWSSKKDQG